MKPLTLENAVAHNVELHNAILTTPDRWGQTGRVRYDGAGKWTFHPDEPSVESTSHPRSEICIPRLDRTKTFTPPGKLHRLEQKLSHALGPDTFKVVGGRLCTRRTRSGIVKVAAGMTAFIGKGTFMDKLDHVMGVVNKAGHSEMEERDALIANIESGLWFAVRRKGTKLWKAPVYPVGQYRGLEWDLVSLGKPSENTSRLERLLRLNETP